MQTDDTKEKVARLLVGLPDRLDTGEVVSLLCTIAAAYAEEEDEPTNMAPIQAIEHLQMALGMMIDIREAALEKQTSTLQ